MVDSVVPDGKAMISRDANQTPARCALQGAHQVDLAVGGRLLLGYFQITRFRPFYKNHP